MIKIIGPEDKIKPLINSCQLLGHPYTLDCTEPAQGIFLYSNKPLPYLPLTYCYLITENPTLKNNSDPNIFYTDNINSPLFPSLFANHFSNQQKESFKKAALYNKKSYPSFIIKENIANFYYPQNKLILHTLSNEISSLSIAKYIADYYAKKQFQIHLYTSTKTTFQKKKIEIIPQINTLITIYGKKHLHIIDAKKEPPLSSFFEDSKRLLLIHNTISEVDWLENNQDNLNHTALLFIKFSIMKKAVLRKKFSEHPIFHLSKSNHIPKSLFQWISTTLDQDF